MVMKRIVLIISALMLSVSVFAQVQITTKKEKLSDFITKTTKVVLSGNEFLDQPLKEAMKNLWIVTPFEFCTMEEFSALKSSGDYYFMVPVKVKQKKEEIAGIYILSIVKGGTGEQIGDMLTLTEFPLCAAVAPSGREMTMVEGIIDILQEQAKKAISTGRSKISGAGLTRISNKNIFISKEDLSPRVSAETISSAEQKGIIFCPPETADEAFINGSDAAVSYVVASGEPTPGSKYHVMLIGARTHVLYYFATHKVSKKSGAGFTNTDIHKIRNSR